jgi:hypothetical protein
VLCCIPRTSKLPTIGFVLLHDKMAVSDAVKFLTRFIRERDVDGIGVDRDVSKVQVLYRNPSEV